MILFKATYETIHITFITLHFRIFFKQKAHTYLSQMFAVPPTVTNAAKVRLTDESYFPVRLRDQVPERQIVKKTFVPANRLCYVTIRAGVIQ